MDQKGFLRAERKQTRRKEKLVRPQSNDNEHHHVDSNGLYQTEGTDGNQMNTDEEVLEVGAGDVQDTGGSAGSGLQSGLGQGMAMEGDDEKAQEIDDDEGIESEEGRKGQAMPTPMTVSRKEREEHELTHLPYRSWCAHCVRGRGRNMPHKHLSGNVIHRQWFPESA